MRRSLYSPYRRPPSGQAASRGWRRGFTLIELMVVVIIISILAGIAIPGIARRLKQTRAKKSAEIIANLYRSARMRAMGRGSAVLVRYDSSLAAPNGPFVVLEAVAGDVANTTRNPGGAGCEALPVSSCLNTAWLATDSRLVSTFDPTGNGDFTVTVNRTAGATAYYDVCFTPLGRAYERAAAGNALTTMTNPAQIEVAQGDGFGLKRNVSLPPNGIARVTAE